MFDWNITFGNILTIIFGVGTLIGIYIKLQKAVDGLGADIRVVTHDYRNIALRQDALDEMFRTSTAKLDEDVETIRHQTGEMGNALRQKTNDIELYVRDNYVRKDTFTLLMAKLENDIKLVGERIEVRLLRMENKIDQQGSKRGALAEIQTV